MLLNPDEGQNTPEALTSDPLDVGARSALMAKVRATGNKSTEARVEAALISASLSGWEKHARDVVGRPDFLFRDQSLAIFVDGCFWHACPVCKRHVPSHRSEFWQAKIDANRRRDNRQRRLLRQQGYHVIRVWEHELRSDGWLARLQSMLRRSGQLSRDA